MGGGAGASVDTHGNASGPDTHGSSHGTLFNPAGDLNLLLMTGFVTAFVLFTVAFELIFHHLHHRFQGSPEMKIVEKVGARARLLAGDSARRKFARGPQHDRHYE